MITECRLYTNSLDMSYKNVFIPESVYDIEHTYISYVDALNRYSTNYYDVNIDNISTKNIKYNKKATIKIQFPLQLNVIELKQIKGFNYIYINDDEFGKIFYFITDYALLNCSNPCGVVYNLEYDVFANNIFEIFRGEYNKNCFVNKSTYSYIDYSTLTNQGEGHFTIDLKDDYNLPTLKNKLAFNNIAKPVNYVLFAAFELDVPKFQYEDGDYIITTEARYQNFGSEYLDAITVFVPVFKCHYYGGDIIYEKILTYTIDNTYTVDNRFSFEEMLKFNPTSVAYLTPFPPFQYDVFSEHLHISNVEAGKIIVSDISTENKVIFKSNNTDNHYHHLNWDSHDYLTYNYVSSFNPLTNDKVKSEITGLYLIERLKNKKLKIGDTSLPFNITRGRTTTNFELRGTPRGVEIGQSNDNRKFSYENYYDKFFIPLTVFLRTVDLSADTFLRNNGNVFNTNYEYSKEVAGLNLGIDVAKSAVNIAKSATSSKTKSGAVLNVVGSTIDSAGIIAKDVLEYQHLIDNHNAQLEDLSNQSAVYSVHGSEASSLIRFSLVPAWITSIPVEDNIYSKTIRDVYENGFIMSDYMDNFLKKHRVSFDYIQAIVDVTSITNVDERNQVNEIFLNGIRMWYSDHSDNEEIVELKKHFNTNIINLPIDFAVM